jgi:plastocyanin
VIIFSKSSPEAQAITAHVHQPQITSQKEILTPETPEIQEAVKDGPKFTLKGVIQFEGAVPPGKKLNLPSGCGAKSAGETYSNEVIVNDGKLQNVLIRVVKGIEVNQFQEVPTTEVILDQKGCQYSPRVVAARVGQKVTFINSDPIFHNVRSVTSVNQKFNMAMPRKDQRETKIFNKPEIFLQTKCSVHPWMTAYVAVMDHPFYDISDGKGDFEIKDLPVGTYTIEAWHETLGTQTQEIKITPESQPLLKFSFKYEE